MRNLRGDYSHNDPAFSRMPDCFPANRRISYFWRFFAFWRQLDGMLRVPGLRPDTGLAWRPLSRSSTGSDGVSRMSRARPDSGRLRFRDDRAAAGANASESRFAN